MTFDITVPELGESVTEATVAKWFKAPGEAVARDEPLVELETDKVALEVNAASAGLLADIVADVGEDVEVGAVLGHLTEGNGAKAPEKTNGAAKPAPAPATKVAAPAAPAVKVAEAMVLSPAVRAGSTRSPPPRSRGRRGGRPPEATTSAAAVRR